MYPHLAGDHQQSFGVNIGGQGDAVFSLGLRLGPEPRWSRRPRVRGWGAGGGRGKCGPKAPIQGIAISRNHVTITRCACTQMQVTDELRSRTTHLLVCSPALADRLLGNTLAQRLRAPPCRRVTFSPAPHQGDILSRMFSVTPSNVAESSPTVRHLTS